MPLRWEIISIRNCLYTARENIKKRFILKQHCKIGHVCIVVKIFVILNTARGKIAGEKYENHSKTHLGY